jgi:hypothetical protein
MGVRQSHYKGDEFIPTHFFHYENPDGCGGESVAHYMMKSIAAEELENIFPNAEVELEVEVGDRIADVRAKFEIPMKPYGKGIIVEAQHKNEGKDIAQVGREYFDMEYSVYWAYLSDFEDEKMEWTDKRLWKLWPEALPHRTGVEGYPIPVRDFMRRAGDPNSATMDVIFPLELYQDFALDILSPTQVESPGWETRETVWLYPDSDRLCWFNLLEAPNGRRYLEMWIKDNAEGWAEHSSVPLTRPGIGELSDFIDEVSDVDESVGKPSGTWWTVANAHLPGYEGAGEIRLSAAPDGDLVLFLERSDRKQNCRSITIPWKTGDGKSLQEVVSAARILDG